VECRRYRCSHQAKVHITGTIDNPKLFVQNASLVLRDPKRQEPIIAVHGLDMNIVVEKSEACRMIAVAPVQIFKKDKLSLGVADGLVKLIAPDLHSSAKVAGEISLSFKKLRVPLGVAEDQLFQRLEAEGTLKLHQVSAVPSYPIAQVMLNVLADLHGKPAASEIRIVDDAEINIQIRDGKLVYDGLRVGIPGIDPGLQISSRGSVGLDETLDLQVDLPRLDPVTRKQLGPAKCRITGTVSNPKVAIQNASLVVREPKRQEPIIAAHGIDLTMQVEKTEAGRVISIAPVQVFKKDKLSLGLADGLVKLIAPDLHSSAKIAGEISLAFKKLRVPLAIDNDRLLQHLEMEGTVRLHQVSAVAKNPMVVAVLKVLADMHGKPASNEFRIVDDAEIHLQMRGGKVVFDGMRMGIPGIDPALVITSRGSVGLDETIDLRLELPRLLTPKSKDKGPVLCRITGTITDPRIALEGASLAVHLVGGARPCLMVDNLHLKFSVESTKDGRVLTLAPVTVLDKRKLTPEVGDELLHLIVPTLADVTGVQGEISLSLDTFRVPLDVPPNEFTKRVEVAGKLQLHQISADAKTPLLGATVKVLADMHGKKPSEVVRVVENADVRFRVQGGRIYHEGLRMGLPDIEPKLLVTSSGSVGLDKSLDIVLEVPRVVTPFNKGVADPDAPVRLRVTGTIDNPVVTEMKGEKGK
jgi:hypothetical protein